MIVRSLRFIARPLLPVECFLMADGVMDIRYLPIRPMSQHMHVLGLLGPKGDSLVSSLTFSIFLTDTRIQ